MSGNAKGRHYRRLTLRRADGRVYLNRWGFSHDRIGGVLLHRMDAPDPGVDLHDHPWWFVSIILWGGYTEQRADVRTASMNAARAMFEPGSFTRGWTERRGWMSVRTMRLDEAHTITDLTRSRSWSLVIKGPRRRQWGFYLPDGYMPEAQYDATVRAERRDLWSDQRAAERPWATHAESGGAGPVDSSCSGHSPVTVSSGAPRSGTRLLVDSGDMTPMAAMQLRKLWGGAS